MSKSNDLNKEILIFLSEQFGTSAHAGRINTVANARFVKKDGTLSRPIRTAPKGTPDVRATIYGRSVTIEGKVDDEQLESQKEFEKAEKAAGGVYLLVKSVEHVKLGLIGAGIVPVGGWKGEYAGWNGKYQPSSLPSCGIDCVAGCRRGYPSTDECFDKGREWPRK